MGRLPSGYTEVEWIESSGSQYINTNITSTPNECWEIGVSPKTSNIWYSIFLATSKETIDCMMSTTTLSVCVRDGVYPQVSKSFDQGVKHDVTINITNSVIVLESEGVSVTESISTGHLWYFFSRNNGTQTGQCRLYYARRKVNNETVNEFVPCINPSNEIGLYDLCSESFLGNSGTGVFTTGLPIVDPVIPTWGSGIANIYDQTERCRALVGRIRLPKEYQEVAYIQGTGTQHIVTDINAQNVKGIKIKFQATSNSSWMSLYGLDGVDRIFEFRQWSGTYGLYRICVSDVPNNTTFTVTTAESHILQVLDGYVTVDGEQKLTYTKDFSITYNRYMDLFKSNSNNEKGRFKIYSCIFYSDNAGTKLAEYVPCINSQNEVGMYNLISNTFCGNAGTGAFIAGPVV